MAKTVSPHDQIWTLRSIWRFRFDLLSPLSYFEPISFFSVPSSILLSTLPCYFCTPFSSLFFITFFFMHHIYFMPLHFFIFSLFIFQYHIYFTSCILFSSIIFFFLFFFCLAFLFCLFLFYASYLLYVLHLFIYF